MTREAPLGEATTVAFAGFVLNRATRQLLEGGEERHLEPKAFELLSLLLSRRPNAVSKAEIRDRLWPDTFVMESNLTGLVAQVRQALGERQRPRFIRTVHGFGYAFAGEATDDAGAEAQGTGAGSRVAATSKPPMVLWEGNFFALHPGENVIGRSGDAAVCIERPGVSRRHARIVCTGPEAVLEDLGSKNGTFVREERLTAPRPLADGDLIRLGRLLLEFRSPSHTVSTCTEGDD